MKIKFLILSCLAIVFLLNGCKSDFKQKLPNTPEEVVVAWQRYIDLNLLDSARILSTPQTIGYIDFLEKLSVDESLESDLNKLNGLTTVVTADTAQCDFYFEYELGEKVPGRLFLFRENGQWKVDRVVELDIPLPDSLNTLEEQEIFQDSIMKD